MKYHQVNRVDIRQGEATLSAYIGEQEILSIHTGGDWTVGAGAQLQDIVTAAVALLEFTEKKS